MDTLLLNADAQPVSFLPLSAISWKDAIVYMWQDKCVVLEWYEDWTVRSEKWETNVPAVIMLKEMMKSTKKPRFSKNNVFLRDNYICQYCEVKLTRAVSTVDHVIPQSYGGKSVWENVVTSCGPCNHNKGNNKKIVPKVTPRKPTYYELVKNRRELQWAVKHDSWNTYLQ